MSKNDQSQKENGGRKFPLVPIVVIGGLLALAIFGDKGVLHLVKSEAQKEDFELRIARAEETNAALRHEIDSLRNDRGYLEAVARKELGMVKDDELVYQFRSGE